MPSGFELRPMLRKILCALSTPQRVIVLFDRDPDLLMHKSRHMVDIGS